MPPPPHELNACLTALERYVHADDSGSVMAVRLFEQLPQHPVLTVGKASELLASTRPTTTKAMQQLEEVGILREVSGRKRDRIYHYVAYLDLLRGDTDL